MSDKYQQAIEASKVTEDDAAVTSAVAAILDKSLEENNNQDVYRFLFNCIDLTTLKSTDSPSSVAAFTEKVNKFEEEYPELKNVAAICVYPNFAQVVRTVLDVSDVEIACVSGGFPSSQTFVEVKVAETSLALASGADEIDIVLPLGYFLDGDYESVCDDISEQKAVCGDRRLKVILESGALKTAANIKKASVLAMYSGADFLKTSTGKEYPGADLNAAYVMMQCIKEYHTATGRRVGFKVSGGVSTTDEALKYYTLAKNILGEEWMSNEYFRIGASRLANNLLGDILGNPTVHF